MPHALRVIAIASAVAFLGGTAAHAAPRAMVEAPAVTRPVADTQPAKNDSAAREVGETARETWETGKDAARRAWQSTRDFVRDAWNSGKSTVKEGWNAGTEKAGEVSREVKEGWKEPEKR